MQAHVFEVIRRELRGARQRLQDTGERSQLRAGKDVFLNPVAAAAISGKRAVVHRDRLDQHAAVRFQQAIAGAEELVVKFVADCLEHFDADELVVAAAEVAVVLEEKLDGLAAEALAGVVVLLAADRRGGDVAAVVVRGMERERPPPGADFEHAVAGRKI